MVQFYNNLKYNFHTNHNESANFTVSSNHGQPGGATVPEWQTKGKSSILQ